MLFHGAGINSGFTVPWHSYGIAVNPLAAYALTGTRLDLQNSSVL